ncbi:Hypothetical protein CINCED_3A019431 [Cinara cedri]|nr:Hypothetical protein CINCED_3A019431 [Cinara cedri]
MESKMKWDRPKKKKQKHYPPTIEIEMTDIKSSGNDIEEEPRSPMWYGKQNGDSSSSSRGVNKEPNIYSGSNFLQVEPVQRATRNNSSKIDMRDMPSTSRDPYQYVGIHQNSNSRAGRSQDSVSIEISNEVSPIGTKKKSSKISTRDIAGPSTSKEHSSIYLHPNRAVYTNSNSIVNSRSQDGISIEASPAKKVTNKCNSLKQKEANDLLSITDAFGDVYVHPKQELESCYQLRLSRSRDDNSSKVHSEQKAIKNNSSTNDMRKMPRPLTSGDFGDVYIHPEFEKYLKEQSKLRRSVDDNSIEESDHAFAESFEANASSLTSLPEDTPSVHSYHDDYQWDRRRRSSSWTGRYSDKIEPEFENLRTDEPRGSVSMHSLSESLEKLTFTQSLAFPELARKLANRRRQEELRVALNETGEEDFETCSKFIAVAGMFLLSVMGNLGHSAVNQTVDDQFIFQLNNTENMTMENNWFIMNGSHNMMSDQSWKSPVSNRTSFWNRLMKINRTISNHGRWLFRGNNHDNDAVSAVVDDVDSEGESEDDEGGSGHGSDHGSGHGFGSRDPYGHDDYD